MKEFFFLIIIVVIGTALFCQNPADTAGASASMPEFEKATTLVFTPIACDGRYTSGTIVQDGKTFAISLDGVCINETQPVLFQYEHYRVLSTGNQGYWTMTPAPRYVVALPMVMN